MFVFTFANYNDNGHVGVWNSIFKVIYCCNCRYICPAGGSNMFEYIVTSSCHSRHIRPRFKRGLTHYCPFQAICGIQCNFKLLQGHVQYDMSFSQCACFRHQYTIIVKDVNFGPLLCFGQMPVQSVRKGAFTQCEHEGPSCPSRHMWCADGPAGNGRIGK